MTFKALVTQNERGRSMVEILGVLAIIGVLSFGGIQGYKYAMDKHRANDIVNEVNMRATDIWHLYQDGEKELPDSPDEDAFPEYGEMTQTGFEIMVTSHPPVAFRTWVNDVPTAVCQKVLQENLNDAIQGLKFVQVGDVDAENLTRYTGDPTICGESGTMNQMVFTSFLDEDGGAVGAPVNPDNPDQKLEHCVDDEDCESCCGIPLCDEDTMTCSDGCTAAGKVCNNSSCECVECMEDEDCPSNGQICDPATNECVSVPEKCGEGERFGKEYRAKNGACVPCTYISEVLVMNSDDNDGIFEVEVAGKQIKDTRSGQDMCRACTSPQHRVEESGSGASTQTYCATGCIIGNSFLSKANGCIRCDSMTETEIPNEDQALAQCLACPNRIWFRYFRNGEYRCVLKKCPDGYFKHFGKCRPCVYGNGRNWPDYQDFYSAVLWSENGYYHFSTSDGNMLSAWSAECTRCANSSDSNLRANYQVAQTWRDWVCTDICGENQFQNSIGTCYDCDTDETPSFGTTSGNMSLQWLHNKCTSCTTAVREAQAGKCVKVNSSDCEDGEFKGSDYKCYPCDHPSRVHVFTDANNDGVDDYGGCTSVCGKQRFLIGNYCYKDCGDNYIMNYSGECIACSSIGMSKLLGEGNYPLIDNLCRNKCGEGAYDVYHCDYKYCAPTNCGTGKLHTLLNDYSGPCDNCPTASSKTINMRTNTFDDECLACGNHMVLGQYCVYYNPSVSGVCNNDSPDTTKFPNYPAGEGVYYRDSTGVCRRCDDQSNSYATTEEECNSCVVNGVQIRRLVNGYCVYGSCTEGIAFPTSIGCVGCNTNKIKVAISSANEVKMLCEQCNRRVMTVHLSEETYESYCVQECDAEEWQDIAGECHAGIMDSSDGKNEIGSDDVSINKCHNSGRIAEQEGNQYFCMPKE